MSNVNNYGVATNWLNNDALNSAFINDKIQNYQDGFSFEKSGFGNVMKNNWDEIMMALSDTPFAGYAAGVEEKWNENPFTSVIGEVGKGLVSGDIQKGEIPGLSIPTGGNKDSVSTDSFKEWEDFLTSFMNNFQSASDKANQVARENAQTTMDFQERMAKQQMDFQREMSNTAFQRQVADMTAAGLNPLLMYGHGGNGASTPSGSSASGATAQTFKSSDVFTDIIGGIITILGSLTSAFKAKK